MKNTRHKYSSSQTVLLLTQVERACPLCSEALFYKKNNKSYNKYQIAHIYPLNPTQAEIRILEEEPRLSEDVNDENNVIPLCPTCHGKFDKPRTTEGYRELYHIKKQLIDQYAEKELWKRYAIEDEINKVIDAIYKDSSIGNLLDLEFKTKKVGDKLGNTISRPTKMKIKNNIQDYYFFIKQKFSSLDQSNTDLSDLISSQIKTYYLNQKKIGHNQQIIFDNISLWIHNKTKSRTRDASEILTSFFIQNCEVFE